MNWDSKAHLGRGSAYYAKAWGSGVIDPIYPNGKNGEADVGGRLAVPALHMAAGSNRVGQAP